MSNVPESPRNTRFKSIFLATISAQVGCLTLLIALAAVFGGLWIDQHFNTRPMFTIFLLIASIPISLAIMFYVVRLATARLGKDASKQKNAENSLEQDVPAQQE